MSVDTWHIVRDSDGHYVETFRGTEGEADSRANRGVWTIHGMVPAHAVPCEPDYPATVQARAMADSATERGISGPGIMTHDYADYIQRSIAEKLARGVDRRTESLGALLVGNDGD